MALTDIINEDSGSYTITGPVHEVREFAYCLEEAISKGHRKDELGRHMDNVESGKEYITQFNFTAHHRIYYEPGRIFYRANAHDAKFWFPIIKKGYDEAMRLYRGRGAQ